MGLRIIRTDSALELVDDQGRVLAREPFGVALSTDVEGHEHKGKGPGGGQFTKGSSGGGMTQPTTKPKKEKLTPEQKQAKSDAIFNELMSTKTPADAQQFRAARADGVAIPPAWTEVKYYGPEGTADKGIVAVGRDSKRRWQRAENPQYRQRVSDENNARIARDLFPRMQQIRTNLRADAIAGNEEAKVLYLISLTGFRNGGVGDGKAKEQAFGASSLMGQHVKVDGDTVTFDFPGKKGVRQQHSVTDPVVAAMMRSATIGKKVFNTNATKVLKVWQAKYGGERVHDIRHVVATEIAQKELSQLIPPPPKDDKQKDAIIKKAGIVASKTLGNNPAQAIETYINPKLWDSIKVAA